MRVRAQRNGLLSDCGLLYGREQHRSSLDSLAALERLIEAQHLQLVERGIIPRDVDEDIFSLSNTCAAPPSHPHALYESTAPH